MIHNVRLDELCIPKSSNLAQKDILENVGEYPVYGASGHIRNINFYHQKSEYIAVVKDGAGIGRTMLLPAKSSIIGTMQYLIPKNNVDTKYLYYAVKSMNLSKYFSGATIPHIYFKDYKKELVPLYSKDKQKLISSSLEKLENILTIKQQQLVEYDQLIKSRFVEMFGEPKTNSKRLPLVKPEEICESISAGGDRPNEVSSIRTEEFLYPIFSNGEKDDGLYGWSKGYRIEKPAVTISGRGTIGYTSFRKDGKFTPIVRLIVMIPNERINPIYLTYYMNLEREIGSGSGVQQLTVPMIKEKRIILPDIADQKDFALLVQQVDKLKFAVQQSLNETQQLFDSLMQEYFG